MAREVVVDPGLLSALAVALGRAVDLDGALRDVLACLGEAGLGVVGAAWLRPPGAVSPLALRARWASPVEATDALESLWEASRGLAFAAPARDGSPAVLPQGLRRWRSIPVAVDDEPAAALVFLGGAGGGELPAVGEALAAAVAPLAAFVRLDRAERGRLELQAILRRVATDWHRTFDCFESPLVVLDAAGRVDRLNRAARDLSLGDYREAIGRPVRDLGPHPLWPQAEELGRRAQARDSSVSQRVHDAAAGKTWDVRASLVVDPEGRRVIVAALDVTQLVQLQDSLRKTETMAAIGTLSAGVAHEVRNPLFGISSNIDALEAELGAHSDVREILDAVRRGANRLTALMEDLLDLGRVPEASPVEAPLEAVTLRALEAVSSLAARSGIGLVHGIEKGRWRVAMDLDRLQQVFENLLQNAIHHSPAGGHVLLAAEAAADGRPEVACSVSDSGPGFLEADLPRVFEPFFSRRQGGTGLGLAIAKRIVEEHGGTIAAGNRPGGGAITTVTLPCRRAGERAR